MLSEVEVSRKDDPVQHNLHVEKGKSEEDIAAYITLVIENGDISELAYALGVAAKARGMSEIAQTAGLPREALYKALRPDAHPRFETISRVCAALGVRLVAQPIHP